MRPKSKTTHSRNSTHGRTQPRKVGDSAAAARKIGGKGDFGAPESDTIERSYASSATRRQDKGGGAIRSGEDGVRTSGVGGNESGPGSSSGGDADTDIIGVGTGGSTLAASGAIEEPAGADDVAPDDRKGKPRRGKAKRADAKMRGSTVDRSGGDLSTTGSGQGTSAVTNPMARNDDSFAAEISNDEASGADNSLSDNS